MNRTEIFNKTIEIFKDVFNTDSELTLQSNLRRIKGWDSMGQFMFFQRLQEMFSIKFSISEMTSFQTAEDIVSVIEQKIK